MRGEGGREERPAADSRFLFPHFAASDFMRWRRRNCRVLRPRYEHLSSAFVSLQQKMQFEAPSTPERARSFFAFATTATATTASVRGLPSFSSFPLLEFQRTDLPLGLDSEPGGPGHSARHGRRGRAERGGGREHLFVGLARKNSLRIQRDEGEESETKENVDLDLFFDYLLSSSR